MTALSLLSVPSRAGGNSKCLPAKEKSPKQRGQTHFHAASPERGKALKWRHAPLDQWERRRGEQQWPSCPDDRSTQDRQRLRRTRRCESLREMTTEKAHEKTIGICLKIAINSIGDWNELQAEAVGYEHSWHLCHVTHEEFDSPGSLYLFPFQFVFKYIYLFCLIVALPKAKYVENVHIVLSSP